jgi:hypothetical protein
MVGLWVCHAPTGTWLELVAIEGDFIAGLGLRPDDEHIFEWKECYHATPMKHGGTKA